MHQVSFQTKHTVTALILSTCLLSGCSSDSDNVINREPASDGVASVSFSNVSITDFSGNPVTRADGSVEQERIGYNLGDEQGFQLVTQQGSAVPASPQTRSVSNLPDGIHYRVVVYKSTEYPNRIYKQCEYKGGSSTPISGNAITLPAGTYKIFAYSFNTATTLPELTSNTISVNDGDDFMTADVANKTINSSDMGLSISFPLTFKRRCCNIWVKVESIAYTNTAISNCTVSLNNLPAEATWSVQNAAFTQTGTSITSKTYFSSASSGSNKPLTASKICLPLGSRKLSMNYNFKTNAGKTTFKKADQELTVTNFTSGNQYLFRMSGVGAYVPSTGSATINGVKWSATNAALGKKFVTSPLDYGYYFIFDEAQTACPSTWSTPSESQFQSLKGKVMPNGSKVYLSDKLYQVGALGNCQLSAKSQVTIFKDGSQVLIMPNAGIRDSGGHSGSTPESYGGVTGCYWSNIRDVTYGSLFRIRLSGLELGFLGPTVNSGCSVRCVQ